MEGRFLHLFRKFPLHLQAKAIITFSPNEEPVPLSGNNETRLSKVIFHLFNFKDGEIVSSNKVIRSENFCLFPRCY